MRGSFSFSELTKDLSPERRERIELRKEQLRQEMTLAELRRAFSLTEDTLAKNLNVKQAENLQDREPRRHAVGHPAQLCPGRGW
jgi:hypothetical protein